MTEDAKKPLGRILLKQRAVTQPELDRALEDASPGGPPLATRLIESGTISEVAALKALAEQSGVPALDLAQVCIKLSDLGVVPKEVATRHKLLPVLVREDRVFVAMASPTEKKVIDEIEFVTGKRVFPYIALAGPLMRAISAAYEARDRGGTLYVGPRCPPEILRRAGYTAPTESVSSPAGAPAPAGVQGGNVPATGRSAVLPGAPTRPQPPPPPRGRLSTPSPSPVSAPPSAEEPSSRPSDPDATFRPAASRQVAPVAPVPGGSVLARLGPVASPVIIDDTMQRMAAADELTDADFGLVDREVSMVGNLPKSPAAQPVPPAREGQRTVLVVDDEAEIRKLLRRVLEDRGYRVLEADRGQTALSAVKEHVPDLMILDAMLPEVHGFDIAKRIKNSEKYKHIPIIMVSAVYRGWRFAEDVKASYGVDAYIEKPFKVSELLQTIEHALERGASKPDPERISADAEKLLSAGIDAYKKGDVARAIEHLREGTHIDPLAYRLHFHLGLLYGKEGRIYDAIQELETALSINGGHFPALKNLAVLYQKAGFRNKAIETWERALRVAPDDPTRQSIKEHLVGLL